MASSAPCTSVLCSPWHFCVSPTSMASPDTKDTEVKTSPNDPDLKTTVNAVSVKLPEFDASDPASWFHQAEAQFGTHSVTQDETKFWHVLAMLDAETSARASG